MFDCVPKRPLLPAKKKVTNYCITIEFCIILKIFPYICFPFRRIVKFCSDCFRQFFFFFFFIWVSKKMVAGHVGRWSSYTVTIVWEFASVDSALDILDEWSSYRGARLNRFDCIACKTNKLGEYLVRERSGQGDNSRSLLIDIMAHGHKISKPHNIV